MLLANNDIIASSNSNFKLVVNLSNYYLDNRDVAVFTVNGKRYNCIIDNRVSVITEFNNELTAGMYNYDLAVTRDGDKTITLLNGNFIVRKSLKTYLLGLIHRLYRGDAWLNNLFDSAGMGLSEADAYMDIIKANLYFDTCSNTMLRFYEREAGISLNGGQSEDERKSQLMAKWRGSSKCTLETLQNVADAWRNATIKLEFIGGKIHIKFTSPIGIPPDLDNLKKALEGVKPAHLPIYYSFMYKTWGTAKQAGTWGYHKNNGNWNKLRQNEE